MVKIFYVLIFLHALFKLTNSVAEMLPRSAIQIIVDAAGGIDHFSTEVHFAIANASAWRNGMPASFVALKAGGGGVVSKICFDDGVCWADKMVELDDPRGLYAMKAISTVEKHCPDIPVPKVMGWCERKLNHYFTEWIEGKTLSEWVLDNDPFSAIVKIPENVVTSLAEFVYNLTTCPIPKEKCKNLYGRD